MIRGHVQLVRSLGVVLIVLRVLEASTAFAQYPRDAEAVARHFSRKGIGVDGNAQVAVAYLVEAILNEGAKRLIIGLEDMDGINSLFLALESHGENAEAALWALTQHENRFIADMASKMIRSNELLLARIGPQHLPLLAGLVRDEMNMGGALFMMERLGTEAIPWLEARMHFMQSMDDPGQRMRQRQIQRTLERLTAAQHRRGEEPASTVGE